MFHQNYRKKCDIVYKLRSNQKQLTITLFINCLITSSTIRYNGKSNIYLLNNATTIASM